MGKGFLFLVEQLTFLGTLTIRRSLQAERDLPRLSVGCRELGSVVEITLLRQGDARGTPRTLRLNVNDGHAWLFHKGWHDVVDGLPGDFRLRVPEVVCRCIAVLMLLQVCVHPLP